MIAMKKILVPIDFAEASDAALRYARHLAKALGADLHVMHVMEDLFLPSPDNKPLAIEAGIAARLDERITDDDRASLRAVAVMRKSDAPGDEIVRYAEHERIDLIVMGTHGRVNVGHQQIGSVADQVVQSAPCPVLTVRQYERRVVGLDDQAPRHDRV
jgi:nucleotide-binding universal stress UspA family protein